MSIELKALVVTGQQAVQNGLSQPFDFLATLREARLPLDEGTQVQRDFRRQVRANLTTEFYGRLPHSLVVSTFIATPDRGLREAWAACIRELTALGPEVAPTDDDSNQLVSQFTFTKSPADVGLALELARAYIGAGFIDVTRPLAGELPTEAERFGDSGFTPLASALHWGNAWMTRALLEAGAGYDVGRISSDGAPREAHDLALQFNAQEAAAVIVEFRMREHLAKLSVTPVVAPTQAAVARRRMGV